MFFNSYAQTTTKHENWFEINGHPIEWDKPFGIVLDLFIEKEHRNDKYFEVMFHYRNFPKSLGFPPNEQVMKNSVIHSLKDASWIRSQKADYVKNNFNKRDEKEYWDKILEQKTNDVNIVLIKLKHGFKNESIPCKFYLRDEVSMCCKNISQEKTLDQLLVDHFPSIFDEQNELLEKYKNLQISSGGIDLPRNIPLKFIDLVFQYFDTYNYFLIDF